MFNEGDTQQSGTDKPVALGFRIKLEFGNVGFGGEGKTGVPKEKPQSNDESQQQTQAKYAIRTGS